MFPIMTDAFGGLTDQVQFALLNRTQENFNTVETIKVNGYFHGVMEPIHPRDLLVKPEGERTWKWSRLWTAFRMRLGDYVRDNRGIQYRVMSSQNWQSYVEYQLIEAPTAGSAAA